MNSKRRHFRMACLASVAVLLGACSNTGEIKSDTMEEVVKPAQAKAVVSRAEPVKQTPVTVAEKPVVKPVVVARVAPKTTYVAPKPKPYVAPKAYVPPKPIVVAVHQPQKAKRVVPARAVSRPAPVQRQAVARTAAPKIYPARVPTKAVTRPVYVAQKQAPVRARVQQVSYRPVAKPQRVVQAAVRRPTPGNYSQSRLTGDFAGNYQAEAFINKMVSQHGFNRNYVNGVLSQAKATTWLKKMAYADAHPKKQLGPKKPANWSRYRSRFITSKHINTGTAFYNKYSRSLERAASQYGVPAEYILGIMGVETIYGGNVGTDRALDALATMSFRNERRGKYFASELEAFLLMTRRTGLDPTQPKASYAGALGLPQFMPSNIKKYGVDYDGDGAVNLWTPHDAIGSVANYLSKHGWKRGEIAAIPAKRTGGRGYSSLKAGFKYKYSLSHLAKKGLAPTYPGVSGKVSMVQLHTNSGKEYWVGGNNFYVITRYNHSTHYAMAVHQLAQEIRKKVKPGRAMPRVIEASGDRNLLLQAANKLL